jgi:hypothetical protein
MLRKKGNKYEVRSEDGKKVLGTYDTRKEAMKRLVQIEIFKRRKEKEK